MNDKKKMAELIAECFHKCLSRSCTKCEYIDRPATRLGNRSCQAYLFADHLIANGVTVADGKDTDVPAGWIPVTERKPDLELVDAKSDDIDLYPCLVTIEVVRARNGRYVSKAWYDGTRFVDFYCDDITSDVTHWMPLPEPPKGER